MQCMVLYCIIITFSVVRFLVIIILLSLSTVEDGEVFDFRSLRLDWFRIQVNL